MLDAGQIICEWVRRNGKHELVLAARVTPDEIRDLLPLAKHPVPYGLLRFFLERMIYICRLEGNETEVEFCNSEDLLHNPDSHLGRSVYRSGVPDPAEQEDGAKRAAAEVAVLAYLGAPFSAESRWLGGTAHRRGVRGHSLC